MSPNPAARVVIVPPLGSDAIWASGWTPAEARLAIDQYKRGTFRWAWQLGIDSMSYPPIKSAIEQRLAVPSGLPWTVDGATRAPGRIETDAARVVWEDHLERLLDSTLMDIALFGISIWHHPLHVDPDTLRTEIAPYMQSAEVTVDLPAGISGLTPWGVPYGGVQRWPLAAVGYTAYPMAGLGGRVLGYYAITIGGARIQLPRPGTTEGEWTVLGIGKGGDQPHLRGAICALDMEFTAGMLARRARSNLGVSAGRASPVGILPPGIASGDEIGLSCAETLAGLGTEQTAALFPSGSASASGDNRFKLDKFELTTAGAADYFRTDLQDSILMVALAIMGRGGSLAKTDAQYSNPAEMEVPEKLTRRDVLSIERAANGLFRMLAERNSGPRRLYPKLQGHLPDMEQEQRIKAKQARELSELDKLTKFHGVIAVERDNGFLFAGPAGQARLEEIAAAGGVKAPLLPPDGLPPALVKIPKPTVPITGEAPAGPGDPPLKEAPQAVARAPAPPSPGLDAAQRELHDALDALDALDAPPGSYGDEEPEESSATLRAEKDSKGHGSDKRGGSASPAPKGTRDGLGRSKAAGIARESSRSATDASDRAAKGGDHDAARAAHEQAAEHHRAAAAASRKDEYRQAHERAAAAHAAVAREHATHSAPGVRTITVDKSIDPGEGKRLMESSIKDKGVRAALAKHPIHQLTIGPASKNEMPAPPFAGAKNFGMAFPPGERYGRGEVWINHGLHDSYYGGQGLQKWDPFKDKKPYSASVVGKDAHEMRRITMAHEVGHHLAFSDYPRTHPVTTKAYNKMMTTTKGGITKYAETNHNEYFAECHALYAQGASGKRKLKAADPIGHKMVKDVLKVVS